ncbi:Filamentous haemagglutinin, N-terminal [Methylophilaceae bacterium]
MKRHASLNRIYRLVWNQTLAAWVAVAECARGRGKSSARSKLVANVAAATAALALAISPFVRAGPTDGQVVAGSGAISQAGNTTTVHQSSQNLAINWTDFSVAAHEAVRFNQPNASSIVLNRVLGQSISQIHGAISANGQVFILNPNGILFGAGAQVDVGGLVASTLSLSNNDFMANRFSFSNNGQSGSVVNQGTLTAAQSGYIAMLAPQVINEGVISATLGSAVLAAGNQVTLNLSRGSLVGFSIDKGAFQALVDNKQLIEADGGQVFMSAKAAEAITKAMVNNTGIVEARTMANVSGRIELISDMALGTTQVGGTLDASAPNGGDGGFIETSGASVKVANDARITTAAPSGNTGSWLIDPYDFTVAASGGDITGAALGNLLGSNSITIQTADTPSGDLVGSAGSNGDIFVNDAVSWAAPTTLTLDAYRNIEINQAITSTDAEGVLDLRYGQGASDGVLNGTAASYSINAPVNLHAGENFSTQLGSAGTVKNYYVITDLGTQGSVTARDLQGINGNVNQHYALGANIDASATSGWNSDLADPASYAGFQPLGSSSGFFTGNFDGLGHTISNLMINRPASDNIGLFAYSSLNTISNVGLTNASITGRDVVGALVGEMTYGTIHNSSASGTVQADWKTGGLVGRTYGSSISLSHASASVNGQDMVGGLVGENDNGNISNSYATGSVSGGDYVGGLVGENDNGNISNSYATGSVSGGDLVGGLVGANIDADSIIDYSYATGNVSSVMNLNYAATGGLVGKNINGLIDHSYATGHVVSENTYDATGGLVGYNTGGINNSYATGNVSSTSASTSLEGDSGSSAVGGLVGYNTGGINNSHASGNVTASMTLISPVVQEFAGSQKVGGLVGLNFGSINDSHASGRVTASMALTNVLAGPPWEGAQKVGGLIGLNGGSSLYDNYATGNVTSSFMLTVDQPLLGNVQGSSKVGGLIGSSFYAGVNGSYASGNVISHFQVSVSANISGGLTASNYTGGLLGWQYGGVYDSFATGNVSSQFNSAISGSVGYGSFLTSVTGGLVGYSARVGYGYGSEIEGSHATGAVNSVVSSGYGVNGVGGLVGRNDGSINNSYATGNVTGDVKVGGLVGYNDDAYISNSYATGSVAGNYGVGGLVGDNNYGSITNSYAIGNVTGEAKVGGLVGENDYGSISQTYATGLVTGSSDVGGLVGYNNGGTVERSFWDIDTTGQEDAIGWDLGNTNNLLSLSTLDFLNQANFTSWDFTPNSGTWFMIDGETRPFLQSEYSTSITNSHQLQLMAMDLTANYTLANNIDMTSEFSNVSGLWATNRAAVTPTGSGFVPVGSNYGSPFTGSLDGQNHTISGLSINRSGTYGVGLFGYGNAPISNVGLINVSIVGYGATGGLVGYNYGNISNSYVTGSVSGDSNVGGLVGYNDYGSISHSYSTASVSGSYNVGGLVGRNDVSIDNSYAAGLVTGTSNVGGLVGGNEGTITNSYATGSVSGGFYDVGGLVGYNYGSIDSSYATGNVTGDVYVGGLVGFDNGGSISQAFAAGLVTGSSDVGGLVGYTEGTVENSFWDTNTTGQLRSSGSVDSAGKTTAELLTQTTYTDAGWDFSANTGTWFMIDGETRPFLQSEYSTSITNSHQLQLMAMDLSANYTLANSIDMSGEFSNASGLWATSSSSGGGFVPVGSEANHFTGTFNGQGHTISGLKIYRPTLDGVGLFGYGQGISNLGLIDVDVVGGDFVGGLAGNNYGSVFNSYVTGNVSGSRSVGGLLGWTDNDSVVNSSFSSANVIGREDSVGGLVGINHGIISNSYAIGTVAGVDDVGGLVGNSNGSIINTFATGSVTGTNNVGGLVGLNDEGTISSSFWDTDTTGQLSSAGGTGKTTAELLTQSTYTDAGWNFGDTPNSGTWFMLDDETRPFLQSEYSTSITNSHQLQLMAMDLTANYTLANNIDMTTEFSNVSGLWATDTGASTGRGFVPVGNEDTHFTGSFDGQGHTISGLSINRPSTRGVGLFGYGDATISNLGLLNVAIVGGGDYGATGGLIGYSYGNISNSYVTGSVTGNYDVGGLAGYSVGSIANSYAVGTVSGGDYTGGLVGYSEGSISNSYAGGSVSGDFGVGGLVGSNDGNLLISNSYATGSVSGTDSVGGLVGYTWQGGIVASHATGTVTGDDDVGGLVGYNDGTITNSYATGSVSGNDSVGGLVGYNNDTITNNYATGAVEGSSKVGGLVGLSNGSISNSYTTGSVTGDVKVGGLVGKNHYGTISQTYATGLVTGSSDVGGLVGYNNGGTVEASFWDIDTTGQLSSAGSADSEGKTTEDLLRPSTYEVLGWTFSSSPNDGTWFMLEDETRPFLQSEYSTSITNSHQLQLMAMDLSADYTLANNIDMSAEFSNVSGLWATDRGAVTPIGSGFVPVGQDDSHVFTGAFDGQGHAISGLSINRPDWYGVGLFGYGAYAPISNVGLLNVQITGNVDVGGLVGNNYYGNISNSYVTGSLAGNGSVGGLVGDNYGGNIRNAYSSANVEVNSAGSSAGGLVGHNQYGSISYSYATGRVSGNDYVGGLVGYNYSSNISNSYASGVVTGNNYVGGLVGASASSDISNSHATGSVMGTDDVGGLVGYNYDGSTIINSYAAVRVSGYDGVGGLVGKNEYASITESYAAGVVSGHYRVGGLVGINHYGGSVSESYATGNASGYYGVGGLVGANRSVLTGWSGYGGSINIIDGDHSTSRISNSYAAGSVTGTIAVGGLVGLNDSEIGLYWLSDVIISNSSRNAEISTSYAIGDVSGVDMVGGLVGLNRSTLAVTNSTNATIQSSSSMASIDESYATGRVSINGNGSIGGLLGVNQNEFDQTNPAIVSSNSAATVSSSFWDTDTTGQLSSAGGTGKTTAELLTQSTYTDAGWDFSANAGTWFMIDGETRPFLQSEYSTSISNSHQLQLMAMDLTANYTLANNIDMTSEFANVSGLWATDTGASTGRGFVPVGESGNHFTGSLDGQGHAISGLMINRPSLGGVGLFGYGQGISNLGLIDVDITGGDFVGGLAGNNYGNISNSYVTGVVSGAGSVGGLVGWTSDDSVIAGSFSAASVHGSVSGDEDVGGLVGYNAGDITNSYATGSVSGNYNVGGLVGSNDGNVTKSYATGSVSGSDDVGGLVGSNDGNVTSSYAIGNVTGDVKVGGLVGSNYGSIGQTYATGLVTGTYHEGGIVGSNYGTVTASFWDTDTTGQADAIGFDDGNATDIIGLSTADFLYSANFSSATSATGGFNAGWDFGSSPNSGTWFMIDGETRPFLQSEYSTSITNSHQLQLMAMDLSANYTLANNIDMSADFSNVSGLWATNRGAVTPTGSGFVPVGYGYGLADGNQYTGNFDGQGHAISGLIIDRPSTWGVGLFGNSSGNISNVGLVNVTINGEGGAGGLVGGNHGNISNSFVTGTVIGSDNDVGGLVGRNYGGISNSYASASVTGFYHVGGLVGHNEGGINNSYATGSVLGDVSDSGTGGLVGFNYDGSSISNSYATGNVTGGSAVGGLVGENSYGSVSQTYATGLVTGSSNVGGLVGLNDGGTVTDGYWNNTVNTDVALNNGNGTGLTSEEMRDTANYVGFNFTSTPGASGNNWVLVNADGTLNNTGGATGATTPMLASEYATQIANAHQLQLMAMDLTADYTLVRDVDASKTAGVNDVWTDVGGFVPVGRDMYQVFTGSFDGLGHTVAGLMIDRGGDVGLFGYGDANISNVGLIDANITGPNGGGLVAINYGSISNSYVTGSIVATSSSVGGLVGSNSGSISHSYSTATVSGANDVGGLVGSNESGDITSSYATGNVVASNSRVGGLVGSNDNGTITNSYATGSVSGGFYDVGGLVGKNVSGTITNSYAAGSVSGSHYYVGGLVGHSLGGSISNSYATGNVAGVWGVGGLVGFNDTSSNISQTYATGLVTGTTDVGGLVGYNSGTVEASFWDTDTTGQSNSDGGTGKTTAELLTQTTYTDAGWNFGDTPNSGTWFMVDGETRPFLQSEYSTSITNSHQLQLMAMDFTANYTLAKNIDMSADFSNASGLWATNRGAAQGQGFSILAQHNYDMFSGSLDGLGHTVTGLYIYRPARNYVGLFGYGESNSNISNLGLVAVSITGDNYVGGLVGSNYGSISNSYATGSVAGSNYVGGLVGKNNHGSVTDGYMAGSVTGNQRVGGLVGDNYGGSVSHSHATGSVSGTDNVGGLVGFNYGSISNSYATSRVSGSGYTGGLVGFNYDGSAITNSYATGNVISDSNYGNSKAGGLVGRNEGGISHSYATGMVSGSDYVGGLVGTNLYGASISHSYATGMVSGSDYVGGLVGANAYGASIENSYASGLVFGRDGDVGGLVGENAGSIVNSHANGEVIGSYGVGGLVGYNNGDIDNSYATGQVTGAAKVGGLVGDNGRNELSGNVSNSYAIGSVTGSFKVGGLVGLNEADVIGTFATGSVTGATKVGGLVGLNSGDVIDSFWDKDTSGQLNSDGGTGKTTAELLTQSNYADAEWDFTSGPGTWFMIDGETRPFLQSEYSTSITNSHQLQLMAMDLNANYTLANNIDMSTDFNNVSGMWATDIGLDVGPGFVPVGSDDGHVFAGGFDGLGHTITSLTINRPAESDVALFGYGRAAISNLGLVNVSIKGNNFVAGLVADNYGSISHSFVTGSVEGLGAYVGGLVSTNFGSISNSHTDVALDAGTLVGEVDPTSYAGGLVGTNQIGGSITGSYALGNVYAYGNDVGGLIGHNWSNVAISNSYATGNVVSVGNSVGGLVGFAEDGTSISNSYAAGNVTGAGHLGGLVGHINYGYISNSYALGNVTSATNSDMVGGLIGYSQAVVEQTYAAGVVASGGADVGGLVGLNDGGTVTDGYWNNTVNTDVALNNGNGTGLTSEEMRDSANYVGFNFTSTPGASGNNWVLVNADGTLNNTGGATGATTPMLASEYATQIANAHQLQLMAMDLTADYTLVRDVDASKTAGVNDVWTDAGGFVPVGHVGTHFTGSFDGQGHAISGLTINRPTLGGVGLFGYGQGISNLGLINVDITGGNYVGGLAGNNYGNISNSYVTGSVSGNGSVGGLVGYNDDGTVTQSYSSAAVTGINEVGGLVGYSGGHISQSYATGSVSGSDNVGGLLGYNDGIITQGYSTGSVSGSDYVGGLVGDNDYGGLINQSYATGSVSGSNYVGGLVGYNDEGGTINQSYATGNVAGTFGVGGLVGYSYDGGSISQTYATGLVTGTTDVGGLVGYNSGTVEASFWDTDTTGQSSSDGGIGISAADRLTQITYTDAGWSFGDSPNSGTWFMIDGETRPFLQSEYSTSITNSHQLQLMAMDLTANYTLANNIDMSADFSNASGLWATDRGAVTPTGSGFVPVGSNYGNPFAGSFDGQGHTISSFTFYNEANNVGLFGINAGVIANVGMLDVDVVGVAGIGGLVGANYGLVNNSYATGNVGGSSVVGGLVGMNKVGAINHGHADVDITAIDYGYGSAKVGGLVGANLSTVADSYAEGLVQGIGSNKVGGLVGTNVGRILVSHATADASAEGAVGGLVGFNYGEIYNSYATGSVVADSGAGGLVGYNYGDIYNSYASGVVNAAQDVGGLVGFNDADGWLYNSFYDVDNVLINGSHQLTVGGIYSDQFGDYMRHNQSLNIANYLTADGSGNYQIGSLQNFKDLLGFAESDYSFVQTATIDLQMDAGLYIPYFAGYYAADNVAITNAVIDAASNANIGLFGDLRGSLDGVMAINVDVTGGVNVGGLVGRVGYGAIVENSYANGVVSSTGSNVGGAVGSNYGNIGNVYTEVDVTGGAAANRIGGLVGKNYGSGNITSSAAYGNVYADINGDYGRSVGGLVGHNNGSLIVVTANGAVSGNYQVGGLVGVNNGLIAYGYAHGNVTGNNDYVGGLVGLSQATNGDNEVSISDSAATGDVAGRHYVGGLVGANSVEFDNINADNFSMSASISNSYATGAVTGEDQVGGLVGQNSSAIRISNVNYSSFNSSSSASISNSYATGNVIGGARVGGLVGENYSEVDNDGGTINGSSSLASISSSYATGEVSGNYQVGGLVGKNNNTIDDLDPGVTDTTSTASISASYASGNASSGAFGGPSAGGLVGANYGLIENSHATGNASGIDYIGGLVGYGGGGAIVNSYATGNATGTGHYVGGLVGYGLGSINNSYASGNASGDYDVGGLVGFNLGAITNSYASGAVSGNLGLGGLVGNGDPDAVTVSFWDKDTSGQPSSSGGAGLTGTEMKQVASFSAWGADINNTGDGGAVLRIYEGHSAPLLTSFMESIALENTVVMYNGDAQTGVSVPTDGLRTGTAASGTNVGTYGAYSNQQGYNIVGGNLTINAIPLTAISLNGSRAYDGTVDVAASIFNLYGVLDGESLTLSGVGYMDDRHVGVDKTVNLGTLALGDCAGAGCNGLASNYTFSGGTQTVTITQKSLNQSGLSVASSKVYDGTRAADVLGSAIFASEAVGSGDSTDGLAYVGDTVSITGTTVGTYNDKDVADATTVSFSGLSLTGADANNYSLNSHADAAATITQTDSVVTANSGTQYYNGLSRSITGFSASGLVNAETVSVLSGVTALGSGIEIGDYAVVASGTDANYRLTFVDGVLSIVQGSPSAFLYAIGAALNGLEKSDDSKADVIVDQAVDDKANNLSEDKVKLPDDRMTTLRVSAKD